MRLHSNNNTELFNASINTDCPHCGNSTNLILVAPPHFPSMQRFKPKKVGMVFLCASCLKPIFLKFIVLGYETNAVNINNEFELVERPSIEFEFEFIPEPVVSDFKEALDCYSNSSFNAFGAMCRRTIQSSATELGAKGKSKVQNQLKEMKEMADIDDGTFDVLKQIIIDGHDGAHPHLPNLGPDRAEILLELIKDVMYQLFVRKGKLKKASELRKKQIESNDK